MVFTHRGQPVHLVFFLIKPKIKIQYEHFPSPAFSVSQAATLILPCGRLGLPSPLLFPPLIIPRSGEVDAGRALCGPVGRQAALAVQPRIQDLLITKHHILVLLGFHWEGRTLLAHQ